MIFSKSCVEPQQQTPNEQLWPPYDRELLGAFKDIRHFQDMIEGRAFTLYTDHQPLSHRCLRRLIRKRPARPTSSLA